MIVFSFSLSAYAQAGTSSGILKRFLSVVDLREAVAAYVKLESRWMSASDLLDARIVEVIAEVSATDKVPIFSALATFTLAGVKELASKQDELAERVAALELKLDIQGGLASDTTTVQQGQVLTTPTMDQSSFVASLKEAFTSLGAKLQDGVLTIKGLVTDRVVTKEFEITDKATGDIYCTWIEDGEWVKVKSECKYLESDQNATSTIDSAIGTETATTTPAVILPEIGAEYDYSPENTSGAGGSSATTTTSESATATSTPPEASQTETNSTTAASSATSTSNVL